MPHSRTPAPTTTKQEILDRIRALAPRFGGRAEAAEEARRMPGESVQELLDAGIARILIPPHFGGYGLGVDTWFDVSGRLARPMPLMVGVPA
jgi:3-hydroxy-9,10-secoandrosta-1,3,5(10)-triene-9,17-dione monooxygenase